ncbi:MAG TPA: hypothetical protein VGW76_09915 [Pyrinomonadaceae bacterium]|nr:hypothetical protein [Pyrinomonadaceae bacterium]
MSREKSMIVYVVLTGVGILGAQLVGLFEEDSPGHTVSGLELIWALAGFFLFVGALIGIVLVIRRNMRPMSERDILEWKLLRQRGRWIYIRNAALKGIFFGLLAIAWPLTSDYLKVRSFARVMESPWLYAALFLTCVFGAFYAGLKTWDANERDFKAIPKSAQAFDSLLNN